MTYKGSISKNRDINLIEYRSLKTLDVDLFKYDPENAPWSLIETCDDVDVMIDHFEMIFLNVLNTHAPIKRRRVKHPRIPEWITEEIKAAMREIDRYARIDDKANWRKKRNFVTRLLEKSKWAYFKNLIDINKKNRNGHWPNLEKFFLKRNSNPIILITGILLQI